MSYYLALFRGNEEISAPGYERVRVNALDELITFPMARAPWGEITHFGLYEDDRLLYTDSLRLPIHINPEDSARLAISLQEVIPLEPEPELELEPVEGPPWWERL